MDRVTTSPALEAFWNYARAFQTLDPKATAAHFHEPALMITPDGVYAARDVAEVEQVYARVMAELPARHYVGTEFSSLEERRLGDDLTMLIGTGSWVDDAGLRFMHFGVTYTLRRTDRGWRIVVALIHGPNSK